MLNYTPELEKFLFWCQQLIAESLGKKNIGFLPIVSNAPKDHHSLLQLYLDGPKDKFFCIFSLDEETKTYINAPKIPKKKIFLHQKSIGKIKMSQKKALIKTFIKNDIIVFGLGVFLFIVATLWYVFRRLIWIIVPISSCFFFCHNNDGITRIARMESYSHLIKFYCTYVDFNNGNEYSYEHKVSSA